MSRTTRLALDCSTLQPMRYATILFAALVGLVASPTAPLAAAEPPPMPDLGGYTAVAPDRFVSDGEAYFQTPDGLLCAIRPNVGSAGCDGRLPATLADVNEIVLALQDPRGMGCPRQLTTSFEPMSPMPWAAD